MILLCTYSILFKTLSFLQDSCPIILPLNHNLHKILAGCTMRWKSLRTLLRLKLNKKNIFKFYLYIR